MTDIGELKRKACAAIDARKSEIVRVVKRILENPETGFNERRTGTVVTHEFQKMGIPYRGKLARTGIKGRIEGGAGLGPTVGILGELDSLLAFEHPFADPDTGAAHACGHHAQIGMMLGAATGLLSPGVLGHLSGTIVPFAVPAEEFVEVERRLALRKNGDIEFLGGKQELIRLGEFDDIDMAMMCHTASDMGARRFSIGGTSNGHVVKFVEYTGRGAHAGSAPHLGINALNAANIAMAAIHANRETFREEETARVHGMVNRGGDVVNAVPSDVRLEWRVRSSTPDALVRNSARVDRCFKAGALAVGAKVRITTIPGYFPLHHDTTLRDLFRSNAQEVVGRDRVLVISTSRNRGGLHGHGGPEPDNAHMPSLDGGGRRTGAQQGLPGPGLRPGGHKPGEDHGHGGHRPAGRERPGRQESALRVPPEHDQGPVHIVPEAKGRSGRLRRRGGVDGVTAPSGSWQPR